MGRVRTVKWNATPPAREAIEATTREFFGPSATYETDKHHVSVALPMAFSDTRHPVSGDKREGGERYVDVWIDENGDDAIDVETQHVDRFTDAVADELAAVFSWYYDGTIQDGVSRKEYAKFRGETFWPTRGRALERAVEACADKGIPHEKLAVWLAANGWERVADGDKYVTDWVRGDDLFEMAEGFAVLLRHVKRLAGIHGRTLASVLEEIMVPDP